MVLAAEYVIDDALIAQQVLVPMLLAAYLLSLCSPLNRSFRDDWLRIAFVEVLREELEYGVDTFRAVVLAVVVKQIIVNAQRFLHFTRSES